MANAGQPEPPIDPKRSLRLHGRRQTDSAIVHALGCLMFVLLAALGLGMAPFSASATRAESRAVASASGVTTAWTFEGELTVLVRHGSDDGSSSAQSAVHIWFVPGTGWRVELTLSDADGVQRTTFGSDGSTDWSYEPDTNQYTIEPSTPGAVDPRFLFFGGELGIPNTFDLASAIEIWRRIPGDSVTDEGSELVIGRVTERVLISPATCTETVSTSASPAGTVTSAPTTTCAGSCRYWMETETGWVLRSECDDGMGGGFEVDTSSASFDRSIDTGLFQFTPPPGSVQTP